MSATIDDKKLDGAGLATLWGIIKQYIVDNPSIPKATASVLGGIMVGTTLGVSNSGVLNLASGVVSAGTYKSVTVDTYGRVTAGSNPNTLAGYGITDAKISNGSIILGENSITPITSLSGYATQTWVQQQGYLTAETYKGTVTQVKVGTTAYNPTSGVVSLPAYPTTLPASDVYSWAKAASKPSYTASEVGAATSGHTHTTSIATSSAENQLTLAFGTKYAISAGGTSYVFTMPANPDTWRPLGTGANDACAGNDSRLSDSRPASDVYSWAKASAKPSYTYSEVGAASSGHTHTTSLASDSGTSTITLASAGKYKLTAGGTSVIFTMPTIPTVSYPVTSVNSKTGAVTLTASDVGAATSGHTHTLSIATSSGTNALTLAANTKYVLTAGGSTFIFTTPTDTNTWRPLGTGASDACAGNDSRLSNSRPASDVYSWAKASTKPSYAFNEITAGAATIGDGANYVSFRTNTSYESGIYYHTTGNEALVFANKYNVTSWIFANTSPSGRADWTGLSPAMQIKKNCVYINKLIANDTDPSYNLYVNGSMYVTSINGVNVGSSPKFTDTTYTFTNKGATLAWSTTSTIATVGGVDIKVTMPANPNTDTNTWRTVQCNGTSIGDNTLNLKAGTNVSLSNSSGTITITSTDTNTWRPIGTGASDAAAGNHTHGLSIATSSGTNALTLAANTKYVLTAGGSTFIFTTPPDNNTTYTLAGLMGSSAKGDSTTPVYWNGSAWTNCTAYSSASVDYANSAGNADTIDGYHYNNLPYLTSSSLPASTVTSLTQYDLVLLKDSSNNFKGISASDLVNSIGTSLRITKIASGIKFSGVTGFLIWGDRYNGLKSLYKIQYGGGSKIWGDDLSITYDGYNFTVTSSGRGVLINMFPD